MVKYLSQPGRVLCLKVSPFGLCAALNAVVQELWAADCSDSWTSVQVRCLSSTQARPTVQVWLSARGADGQVDDQRLEITIF